MERSLQKGKKVYLVSRTIKDSNVNNKLTLIIQVHTFKSWATFPTNCFNSAVFTRFVDSNSRSAVNIVRVLFSIPLIKNIENMAQNIADEELTGTPDTTAPAMTNANVMT
jgi:hypothetical protein